MKTLIAYDAREGSARAVAKKIKTYLGGNVETANLKKETPLLDDYQRVIIGGSAIQPGGVLRWFLANRVLVFLGTISYGIYLLHWPLFLWIDEARTGLGTLPLFALRLAVTIVVTRPESTSVGVWFQYSRDAGRRFDRKSSPDRPGHG